MAMALLLLFILSYLSAAALALPVPVLDHKQLVCGSTNWEDVLIFFLLNFAAHVATVKTFPGNVFSVTIRWAAAALLIPYSGIVRGCAAIAGSRSLSGETQLQHAARAGALCAFRRTKEWQPAPGAVLKGCKASSLLPTGWATLSVSRTQAEDVDQHSFSIHGHVPSKLPSGYALSKLPKDTSAGHSSPQHADEVQLARSVTFLKSLTGIIQLAFAVVTLYRTRGEQINRFGYAAYGLTVIPYAAMSFINLVAHMLNPDYPALFVVDSNVLHEGIVAGIQIDGVIGKVEEEEDDDNAIMVHEVKTVDGTEGRITFIRYEMLHIHGSARQGSARNSLRSSSSVTLNESPFRNSSEPSNANGINDSRSVIEKAPKLNAVQALKNKIEVPDFGPRKRRAASRWHIVTAYIVGALGLMAPYLIIGLLTHFSSGSDSSKSDRVWTMSWLAFGQVFGFLIGLAMQKSEEGGAKMTSMTLIITILMALAGIPAIGGFVKVGTMLLRSPDCMLGPDSDLFGHQGPAPPLPS